MSRLHKQPKQTSDDFWESRRVFVTGATGLLGSHLIEALITRGAEVTCLVRDWTPQSLGVSSDALAKCTIVRGELEDYELVLRALNEHDVDSVFHLGAQTIVSTASRSPLSTFEANVKGTWVVLEAARQLPSIERIVVASSDKAYGSHEELPYTEETPLVGRFPYDVSKSCADLIALSYAHSFSMPIAVTRCGNLFGPGDLNFNRLIPGTIRAILEGKAPIVRSSESAFRDYLYVGDAVDAYLLLGSRLPSLQLNGQAFNIGTETPMSALSMVRRILQVMGTPGATIDVHPEAVHEIERQYLDCSKARSLLGWHPHRNLDDALAITARWYASWHGQRPLGRDTTQPRAAS